jgi:hypothetical protein
MKFIVSEQHKSQGKRKTIFFAMLVVVFIASLILMLINSSELSNKIFATIGILFLAQYLLNVYRSIKNNDTSYAEVEILETQDKIDISHNGAVVSMLLSDIESLRIQRVKGNVKSLLLTTKSFSNLRFEGYENFSEMAEVLKKYTPAGKTKNATWYHR